MPKISPRDGAPHILVDFIISAGHMNGNIQINVGVHEARRSDDGTEVEKVTVSAAHLRMSPSMAIELANLLIQCADNLETNKTPSVPIVSRPN